MIPAIAAALDNIVGNAVVLQNANGAGRAYELYIMTALADRLRTTGANVWVQRSDGSRIAPGDSDRQFVQRGGAPSGVPGSAQGRNGMSTIAFRLPASSRTWEIWNGVQFSGRSGGKHEFDISIVPAHTGVALRALPTGGVPFGRPVVAIECKDVSTAGSPDEMRAFMARLYDVTAIKAHEPFLMSVCSPLTSIHPGVLPNDEPHTSFRSSNIATKSVLTRRTGFVSGAISLTGYYFIDPRADVLPGSAEVSDLLSDLVGWIAHNLP